MLPYPARSHVSEGTTSVFSIFPVSLIATRIIIVPGGLPWGMCGTARLKTFFRVSETSYLRLPFRTYST